SLGAEDATAALGRPSDQARHPTEGITSPFGGRYLILLCPSRPQIKPSGRQPVAPPPVVESRLLLAPQPPVHSAPHPLRSGATQHRAQQHGDHPPHLRHSQRRCPPFSPAWSPASGT